MGRVLTEATIENLKDVWDAERGLLPPEKVRRITVPDALVAGCFDTIRARHAASDRDARRIWSVSEWVSSSGELLRELKDPHRDINALPYASRSVCRVVFFIFPSRPLPFSSHRPSSSASVLAS
jgi:hypothetical protein